MTPGLTNIEVDFCKQTPKYLKQIAEELGELNRLKKREIDLLFQLVNMHKTEQTEEEEQD